MSNFFNYDAPGAAKAYDRTKIPIGADVIGAMLQIHCGKPLNVCLLRDLDRFSIVCIFVFKEALFLFASCLLLTCSALQTKIDTFASSVDLDETARNDQGIFCSPPTSPVLH